MCVCPVEPGDGLGSGDGRWSMDCWVWLGGKSVSTEGNHSSKLSCELGDKDPNGC